MRIVCVQSGCYYERHARRQGSKEWKKGERDPSSYSSLLQLPHTVLISETQTRASPCLIRPGESFENRRRGRRCERIRRRMRVCARARIPTRGEVCGRQNWLIFFYFSTTTVRCAHSLLQFSPRIREEIVRLSAREFDVIEEIRCSPGKEDILGSNSSRSTTSFGIWVVDAERSRETGTCGREGIDTVLVA